MENANQIFSGCVYVLVVVGLCYQIQNSLINPMNEDMCASQQPKDSNFTINNNMIHNMYKYKQCNYKQYGSVLLVTDNKYTSENCPVRANQNEKWVM